MQCIIFNCIYIIVTMFKNFNKKLLIFRIVLIFCLICEREREEKQMQYPILFRKHCPVWFLMVLLNFNSIFLFTFLYDG